MKTLTENSRIKTIVNPYDFRRLFRELKPVGVIEGYTLASNGKLSNNANFKIVVYQVFANFAALKFLPNEIKGFAYYTDNVILRMKKTGVGSDNINIYHPVDYLGSKLGTTEDADFQYYCHNFGSCIFSRTEKVDIQDKYVIPREIFKDINDYAYLFVCAKKEADVSITHSSFPEDQPFFWDTPVATSLFIGQQLEKSDILLGSVKVIKKVSVLSKKQRYIEKNVVCSYKWDNGKKVVWDGKNLIKQRVKTTCVVSPEKATCSVKINNVLYSASLTLKVFVYQKYRKVNENDITAFVWCSGNEDDIVKKSYLRNGMSCQAAYNKYPFILDSLSLNTIYHSYASLTHVSEENAARYVVRYIAQQPKGQRSVSVEGYLVYLMGGALCWIGDELARNKRDDDEDKDVAENILEDNPSVENNSDSSSNDKWNNKIVPRIDAMFAINDSKLFFDSPVNYKDSKNLTEHYKFAINYLQNVLGIKGGDSGCSRLKELLEALFKEIGRLGLSVDYVYCDIEKLYNDAWMLKVLRFDEHYIETKNIAQATIYKNIWEEIRERDEIYTQMKSLGFYNEGKGVQIEEEQDKNDAKENVLYDIYKVTENKEYYGIANGKSYERRRNLNIWDVVMKNYMNDLFFQNVVKPVQQTFKDAKCSCYGHTFAKGYINHADKWETYLGGSLMLGDDMYSSISLYGDYYSKGIRKLSMDNWKILPDVTPYTFFVDYVNKARASFLSSPHHHFNVFVSSWNIWAYELNKELHFFKNNNINGEDQEEKEKNNILYLKAQAYHEELLYHMFLLNPDKAIAYFNLEPKRRMNDAEDYIAIDEKTYFTESYNKLHDILKKLNEIFSGNKVIPQTQTLAVETEPYVLSCAEVNNKWIWRLTVKELSNRNNIEFKDGSITFESEGRKITFYKVVNNPIENISNNDIGFWIVTPVDVEPQIISKNDYYYKAPALSIDDNSFIEGKGVLTLVDSKKEGEICIPTDYVRLTFPYAQYTIFGELPIRHSISMKFCITKQLNAVCYLLQLSALKAEGKMLLFSLKPDSDKEITSSSAELLNVRSIRQPNFKIELNEIYELKISIDINPNVVKVEEGKSLLSGIVAYSLIKETKKSNGETESNHSWTSGNINWEFKTERIRYLVQELILWEYKARYGMLFNNENKSAKLLNDIVKEELDNIPEEEKNKKRKEIYKGLLEQTPIRVEGFSIHAHGHQEKVELFRESNGLNISRVNKSIAAYRLNTWEIHDSPVEVENENIIDETIIGKFSWLNACECKVRYKLTYSLFDEKGDEISLGDQERPSAAANIIYPLDGRLKLIKVSYKNVIFEVEPQSEGYMLVKLLNCYSKSAKIKWSLYKLEDGDSGTENLLRETSIRIVDIIRNYSCDKKIASINLFKKNGETNYKTKQI